jgi:hypothetical protein
METKPTTVREAVAQVLAAARFSQLEKDVRSGNAEPIQALQFARRFMASEEERSVIDRAISLARHMEG